MSTISFSFYVALKEIWRNRGRFLLLSLVIALITLLVLFIAALGEGLANGNREYISHLNAELIVFRDKSDFSISASRLDAATLRAVKRVEGVAAAGPVHVAASEIVSTPKPIKISLLAADPSAPGMPVLTAGRSFLLGDSKEGVMDRNLAQRSGLTVGDEVELRSVQGFEDKYYRIRIVGLTAGQSYLFQPSLFVSPATWETVRPQSEADLRDTTSYPNIIAIQLADPAQAAVVTTRLIGTVPKIEVADISTTIGNIPGYSAQQATVQTQGFFTLLIGVLVIGGFFQIQVLQKVPQIGMLKAIGSSNVAIGLGAVVQIVVVTTIGVAIGAVLTFLFSLGFPPTVPLIFNGTSAALSILALIVIGPLGGLVSILYAVRIEPLRALRLQ